MQDLWQDLSDRSLGSRLWSLGLKALPHRSCGAYEATDRLLSTHLYGKSVAIRFINTNLLSVRNKHLKPYKQLLEMKETCPESDDIYANSYLED